MNPDTVQELRNDRWLKLLVNHELVHAGDGDFVEVYSYRGLCG